MALAQLSYIKQSMPKQQDVKSRSAKLFQHIKSFQTFLNIAKEDFTKLWQNDVVQRNNIKNFELIKSLGSGAFGQVVLARDKTKTELIAIKVLEKKHIVRTCQVLHCKYEIKILSCIRFVFIIHMNYFFMDNIYLYIGMDYIGGGEMFNHLRVMRRFHEDLARFYAAQIVLSFEYLHNVGITYRDLKPENIMIQKDGYVKLIDCGFCKRIDANRTYTLCGTPEYLAPEVILSKGYGFAVDWWALGILIYEMCAGHPPFYDNVPMKLYEKITVGKYECPTFFSKPLRSIIGSFLATRSTDRYGIMKNGANDIKWHPWYRGFDWTAVLEKKFKPPFLPKLSLIPHLQKVSAEELKFRSSPENEFGDEFADFRF